MFQLLQPIWLFALAGLLAPVIIHFWNQQPGKTLRVGSIALVAENKVSYKKRIQLSEILLLLLRCLLLSCIAIALTAPFWKSPATKTLKGWVLMSRNNLAATYNRFKPTIDSLLNSGMEFHYFDEGLKKEKIETALKTAADSTTPQISSYRAIAASLNQQVDAAFPIFIFTDNYLRNFRGKRTEASLNLHWFTYAADTSVIKTMADTNTLQVTVFSYAYKNDAAYLQAALKAIQQFSKRNINIMTVADKEAIPAQQDWLFWLDDALPPNTKSAKNIFAYAKGKPLQQHSYILPAGTQSFAAIDLYKTVIESDSAKLSYDTRWQDGYGHPLLTVQQENNSTYYCLYTHIDPSWNDLSWSEDFPGLLYQLLYSGNNNDVLAGAADKTIIDSSQVMPVLLNTKEAAIKPPIFTETTLTGFFWLTALLLLFAERCLSFYHRKLITNE